MIHSSTSSLVRLCTRRLSLLALAMVAACSGSTSSPLGTGGAEATGGSGASGGLGPVCATGQIQCATGCADLSSDEANCGSCGAQCSVGTSCVSGSCQCQSALVACSGSCVDTQSSAQNCGTCGNVCTAGSVCSLGQCQSSCANGLTQCGTDCVDPTTSIADCGGCNQACASGQTCDNGVCTCSGQEKLCGGRCVDVTSDPANCGDCGVSCGANACNAGVCATGSGGTGGTGGTGTGGSAGAVTGGTSGSTGGTSGTGGSTGGTCASATYEAEAMTPSGSGVGQVEGSYYDLWANGSLSTTATFSGAQTITVYAAGTAADSSHDPHMIVQVDGSAIGNTTVTPGTTFNAYSFNYTGNGSQTLTIQFDNDYYVNGGGDTNLYVDKVVVSCGTAGTGGTGGSTGGTGGTAGTGGTGGSTGGTGGTGGGTGGTGGGVAPGPSGLPAPPGSTNVPRPSGTPGDITVLNWAGFTGAVTYSFDDDNDSQIQNFSTLQSLGVPFTFYLWTGRTQATNSVWATAVQDGDEIGNHTQSHDPNSHCTLDDINQASQFIQSHLGVTAQTMAAPNGSTCYKQYAQQVFFINRGVSPARPVLPNDNSDPLNLNCYIPAQGQQASVFNANVNDGRAQGGWVIYVVHGFTGDGAAYQPVDLSQLVSAINYTKSLGDMWIGTMVNVGAYWLGQKAFSNALTSTSGSSKTWTWTLPAHFPPGKYLRVTVAGGTLTQNGTALNWDPHGYYEIALDAGSVTLSP